MDRGWRREAVRWAQCPPGGRVLDVCAGSGDLVQAWLEYAQPGRVEGLDFSGPMLEIAKHKIRDSRVGWVRGDAEQLPFRSGSIQALTIGFGLRNLPDPQAGLKEMYRVLKTGGTAVILELTRPKNRFLQMVYKPYLHWYVPKVGRMISGHAQAYTYLRDTIQSFADPLQIQAMCQAAGFQRVEIRPLIGGIATLLKAIK